MSSTIAESVAVSTVYKGITSTIAVITKTNMTVVTESVSVMGESTVAKTIVGTMAEIVCVVDTVTTISTVAKTEARTAVTTTVSSYAKSTMGTWASIATMAVINTAISSLSGNSKLGGI